jgi:hypothetical protein
VAVAVGTVVAVAVGDGLGLGVGAPCVVETPQPANIASSWSQNQHSVTSYGAYSEFPLLPQGHFL